MAFGSPASDDEPISGINVTPLVDVVLVLLVIFMMTAPVLYQSAIQVQLPKAASGQQSPKDPLAFSLTAEGTLLLNGKPLAWEELTEKLKALGSALAETTATISADEKTPHGTVVRLMDQLRVSGLYRFALSVQSQ